MATDVMSYSAFKNNMAEKMKEVCQSHKSLIVTNDKSETVVVLSLEDYRSLEETNHLFKNPENAKKFLEAIKQS